MYRSGHGSDYGHESLAILPVQALKYYSRAGSRLNWTYARADEPPAPGLPEFLAGADFLPGPVAAIGTAVPGGGCRTTAVEGSVAHFGLLPVSRLW